MERMERTMEKLVIQATNQNKNQNQKFRRNNPPNRQRDSDQQVIPPFQDNFLDEDEGIIEESQGTIINMVEVEDRDQNFSTEDRQTSYSHWDKER